MKKVRLICLVFTALALAACNQGPPTPGGWTSSPADFGSIGFSVSKDSLAIDTWNLIFTGSGCGEIALSSIGGYTGGDEAEPIENGVFTLAGNLMVILPGGSVYDLNMGTYTFAGEFSGSDRLAGTWQLDFPFTGDSCNGIWEAHPSP